MADKKIMELISSQYQIGNLIADPILISSGISQCFKIQTDQGNFFVKLIDSKFFNENYYVTTEDLLFSLNLSEKIAKKMLEKKIPCIFALNHLHESILQVGHFFILVYPYIAGYVVNQDNISDAHIQKIAMNLIKIHQLGLDDFADQSVQKKWVLQIDSIHKNISFKPWIKLFEMEYIPTFIKNKLTNLLPFISQAADEGKAKFLMCKNILISHNDIKPKNVLWDQSNHPVLIDWESAGYMEKSVEFLETLLAWCLEKRDYQLYLNESKAKQFINFYQDRVNISPNTINLVAIKWINWLSICSNYLSMHQTKLDLSYVFNNTLEMIYFLKENKNILLSIS